MQGETSAPAPPTYSWLYVDPGRIRASRRQQTRLSNTPAQQANNADTQQGNNCDTKDNNITDIKETNTNSNATNGIVPVCTDEMDKPRGTNLENGVCEEGDTEGSQYVEYFIRFNGTVLKGRRPPKKTMSGLSNGSNPAPGQAVGKLHPTYIPPVISEVPTPGYADSLSPSIGTLKTKHAPEPMDTTDCKRRKQDPSLVGDKSGKKKGRLSAFMTAIFRRKSKNRHVYSKTLRDSDGSCDTPVLGSPVRNALPPPQPTVSIPDFSGSHTSLQGTPTTIALPVSAHAQCVLKPSSSEPIDLHARGRSGSSGSKSSGSGSTKSLLLPRGGAGVKKKSRHKGAIGGGPLNGMTPAAVAIRRISDTYEKTGTLLAQLASTAKPVPPPPLKPILKPSNGPRRSSPYTSISFEDMPTENGIPSLPVRRHGPPVPPKPNYWNGVYFPLHGSKGYNDSQSGWEQKPHAFSPELTNTSTHNNQDSIQNPNITKTNTNITQHNTAKANESNDKLNNVSHLGKSDVVVQDWPALDILTSSIPGIPRSQSADINQVCKSQPTVDKAMSNCELDLCEIMSNFNSILDLNSSSCASHRSSQSSLMSEPLSEQTESVTPHKSSNLKGSVSFNCGRDLSNQMRKDETRVLRNSSRDYYRANAERYFGGRGYTSVEAGEREVDEFCRDADQRLSMISQDSNSSTETLTEEQTGTPTGNRTRSHTDKHPGNHRDTYRDMLEINGCHSQAVNGTSGSQKQTLSHNQFGVCKSENRSLQLTRQNIESGGQTQNNNLNKIFTQGYNGIGSGLNREDIADNQNTTPTKTQNNNLLFAVNITNNPSINTGGYIFNGTTLTSLPSRSSNNCTTLTSSYSGKNDTTLTSIPSLFYNNSTTPISLPSQSGNIPSPCNPNVSFHARFGLPPLPPPRETLSCEPFGFDSLEEVLRQLDPDGIHMLGADGSGAVNQSAKQNTYDCHNGLKDQGFVNHQVEKVSTTESSNQANDCGNNTAQSSRDLISQTVGTTQQQQERVAMCNGDCGFKGDEGEAWMSVPVKQVSVSDMRDSMRVSSLKTS